MATIMYPSLTKSQSMRSKRKSAVELLAESKAFYVKSETVRDSQQVLPVRVGPCSHNVYASTRTKPTLIAPTAPATPAVNTVGWRPVSMPHYMAVSPSRSLPPLRVCNGRRSTSACSDVLQTKLRQLLNTDSRENVSSSGNGSGNGNGNGNGDCLMHTAPISPPAQYAITERDTYRYTTDHRGVHKSLPDLHTTHTNTSASNKSLSNRDSGESSGHYTQRSEPGACSGSVQRADTRRDSGSSTQHSVSAIGTSATNMSLYCTDCTDTAHHRVTTRHHHHHHPSPPYHDPTLSPGPGTFKRQKCFRYKQRDRTNTNTIDSRPILRSKSDISDRYWRGSGVSVVVGQRKVSECGPVSHLEQFFEQLGLNSDSYESMLELSGSSESPVFFSDVSTVDSGRPLDYCAPLPLPPLPSAPLRPSEPPSIVERNARIIKWLCNCRKLQISNS